MTTTSDPAAATAAPAPAAPAPGTIGTFTHRQILTIMSGLMMGMFLAALDQTIVSTAIRTIADDLNGFSVQAWVTTAYLITATISTPLYGKLSDLYGRKPFFMAAISIFVLGSMLCGLATSMYELAAFRAFQGLGAGGLFSLALTIIGDIVPPRERAKYQGYFLAVFGTSSVLGPVLGGLLAGQSSILGITGWRWVFYINVPIGIAALAVVWRVLNLPRNKRDTTIDWWGALTLAIGVVPLLIVAEQGREWGWGSGRSIALYVVGVLGIAAFIAVERRVGDAALIPTRFFRNGTFSLGIGISVITGAAMFGSISLLPQYLQVVKGSSPTIAGFQTLPLVLGIMVASIISGQLISRTGHYRAFPIIGTGLMLVASGLLYFLTSTTPLWQLMLVMLLLGLGLGNIMQPLTLAIQNAMPPRDMGVSTASATFFRQMGGTLGVAVFLSLLFSQLTGKITASITASTQDPAFQQALRSAAGGGGSQADQQIATALTSGSTSAAGGVLNDTSFIGRLDPVLAAPFKDGFTDAMNVVFLAAAALLVVGFLLVLFFKEVPLRTASGISAANAEAGADGAPSAAVAAAPAPLTDDAVETGDRDGATSGGAPGSTGGGAHELAAAGEHDAGRVAPQVGAGRHEV
jgi:EmrB/QacA subfamily drug resistance transporter